MCLPCAPSALPGCLVAHNRLRALAPLLDVLRREEASKVHRQMSGEEWDKIKKQVGGLRGQDCKPS